SNIHEKIKGINHKFRLIMIGDSNESPVHASVGTGNLFQEFSKHYGGYNESWHFDGEDEQNYTHMEKTFIAMNSGNIADLDIKAVSTFEEFNNNKTNFEKVNKSNKKQEKIDGKETQIF